MRLSRGTRGVAGMGVLEGRWVEVEVGVTGGVHQAGRCVPIDDLPRRLLRGAAPFFDGLILASGS